MHDIAMPRLSDSMEEGTILRWLVESGAAVARGDELVEIETDKATMVHEADGDGTIAILVPEGETVPVGAPIARLAADGEPVEAEPVGGSPVAAAAVAVASGGGPGERVRGGDGVNASPLARRVAARRGVDLVRVVGTGARGRIVKADVVAAAGAAPAQASAKGETVVVEPTRVQALIARRMAESRATVPSFTVRTTIDMTTCVALRAELKQTGAQTVPSLNDLVVKACALALAAHPVANGAFRDGRFERYSRVNVGVAVATDDGLVVPTVFDADRKGVAEIARDTRALAERVRAGTVTAAELSGGTFTVSNLGMFGVRSFDAVINVPQAAILAVGAVEPRPADVAGEIVSRRLMDVDLVCDHRVLYGADAARFLKDVRTALEAPLGLAA